MALKSIAHGGEHRQKDGGESGFFDGVSRKPNEYTAFQRKGQNRNDLAFSIRADGVLVNAVDPGLVRTDMGGPSAPRSPQQGADTIVWLASCRPAVPQEDSSATGAPSSGSPARHRDLIYAV